ncbi:MAG: peptidyl-prolyl cis-trans isomerase, partial [Candidatus Sumerlaeia bacterium]|nr:peptidyl-prolyl cis-trans isomerase [Candidatus Sumerlaeia bacterium]
MKIKNKIIFIFFAVSIQWCIAEEEIILARDDVFKYSLADISAYTTVQQLPFAEFMLTGFKQNNPRAISLLKDTLKHLAFRKLYVYQELKHTTPTLTTEFLVRDELRNYAHLHFLKELTSECQITTPELQLAYERVKEQYKITERRKIAVLYKLFPENPAQKEEVLKFLEQLRARDDFKEKFIEYVKQYSDLPGATEGGIVDYFERGTYGPTVEKYAFETPPGEISPVFSATRGAYIIKCLDVKPAGYLPPEEVTPKLRTELFKQKFDELKAKKLAELKRLNKVWHPDFPPTSGNSDLVLVKVNDYQLTSGVLFNVYPQLASDMKLEPDFLMVTIRQVVDKELILQELEKRLKNQPTSALAKELDILKTLTYFRILFYDSINKQITVTEKELYDYYDKYKEFYHGVVPKRLAFILIKPPLHMRGDEALYNKELEWQKRAAMAFYDAVAKSPASFVEQALYLIHVFDWASLFLAEKNGVDAFP